MLKGWNQPEASTLKNVWKIMVKVHFQYKANYQGTGSTRRNFGSGPFLTIEEGIAKGGQVQVERGARGYNTFLSLNSVKYYVAQSGRILDISRPPPSACDQCGAMHWHWECTVSSASQL